MSGIVNSTGAASGIVGNNYAFNAYLSADQEVTTTNRGTTGTKVDFDTVRYGAAFWSASNQRLDVPKTGTWQISYGIKTVDSSYWVAYFFKVSGSAINQGWTKHEGRCTSRSGGDFAGTQTCTETIYLYQGTYLELWWYNQVNFTLESSDTTESSAPTSAQPTWISGHWTGV